ncbi:hypothetical protein ACIQPR_09000 [Streptomyces sp. NPDC091280]|uniref:hypothetical protein n=1 Tax=Streptomyces sp. NPDC091280 TaxID=3365984 RepID=UPI00381973E6
MNDDEDYGPLVFVRTREESYADGSFIKVPPVAGAAVGIKMPTIIAADAHKEFVAGNEGDDGRQLRTVLAAVARAIAQSPANEVCFVVPAGELPSGQETTGEEDQLIAITEPRGPGEPILTLMLSREM